MILYRVNTCTKQWYISNNIDNVIIAIGVRVINIKISKKTQIFIVILGIILFYFMIRQIQYKKANIEWYNLKDDIMNDHKTIDSMSISHNGPYCSMRIETKKEISFIDVEEIFLKILRYLNETELKDTLIEQHENSFRRSDLACLRIVFIEVEAGRQDYTSESWDRENYKIWAFESRDRYEYRMWKFYSNGCERIEYDLYDYR